MFKFILIMLFTLFSSTVHSADDTEFPLLKGPYLGQKPPGMTPKIFAPGIISTKDKYELNSVFSPKGDEFYYVISSSSLQEKEKGIYFYYLMSSNRVNGVWTKPKRASFFKDKRVTDISLSLDGKRLYFCSEQGGVTDYTGPLDIWYIERDGDGWSNPVHLDAPINSPASDTQPNFTTDGTMYFSSGRGGKGKGGLFYARLEDGKYLTAIRMGDAINGGPGFKGNSFVAPDESYVLFKRWGLPKDAKDKTGMYISFKNKDGTWTKAKDTGLGGSLAALSHDHKYLFYSNKADVYWIDAKIIETFRP